MKIYTRLPGVDKMAIGSKKVENYSSYETLLDGQSLHIRAVRSTDKEMLLNIWEHLSAQSIYYRFLSPKKYLTEMELEYFTCVDFKTHVALLGFLEQKGIENPVAACRFIASDDKNPQVAEVAFMVEDEFHGLGIATHLLNHMVKIAKERNISEFIAIVLDENKPMLEVFEHSGLEMSKRLKDYSVWEVHLKLNEPEPCN